MRYKGQPIEKPKPKIIPVLREPEIIQKPDGTTETVDRNIYFKAEVIVDYSEFEEICPEPEAPEVNNPGKAPTVDFNDPTYRLQMEDHGERRVNWVFLKSVEGTEELEWDKVDMRKPETWGNYRQELQDAGFTIIQINHLVSEVYGIQGVDETKVEEARRSFLATQAQRAAK